MKISSKIKRRFLIDISSKNLPATLEDVIMTSSELARIGKKKTTEIVKSAIANLSKNVLMDGKDYEYEAMIIHIRWLLKTKSETIKTIQDILSNG